MLLKRVIMPVAIALVGLVVVVSWIKMGTYRQGQWLGTNPPDSKDPPK